MADHDAFAFRRRAAAANRRGSIQPVYQGWRRPWTSRSELSGLAQNVLLPTTSCTAVAWRGMVDDGRRAGVDIATAIRNFLAHRANRVSGSPLGRSTDAPDHGASLETPQ